MTPSFVSLQRIAALSVAVTLLAVPTASAQSPESAPPIAAPTNTALLSPAAFARLVQQPPAAVAPAPVVKAPLRLALLHRGTTAIARQAQAAPTKAPQQKNWASRNKAALVFAVVVGVFLGVMFGVCGTNWGQCGE